MLIKIQFRLTIPPADILLRHSQVQMYECLSWRARDLGCYEDASCRAADARLLRRTECLTSARPFNMIERDLFGTVRPVRNWGRIGTNGQKLVEVFDIEEAEEVLQTVARAKRRGLGSVILTHEAQKKSAGGA